MGSGEGRGPMSLHTTPQCTPRNYDQSCGSRSRGSGSVCRPCPLLSHENIRRERDALRAELEDARHRFAVEVRELHEAAAQDKQSLVDRLQSKWAQQRARELQKIGEETKKHREAEIRQLLRWKQAELQESQEYLKRERDAAMRQARELQRQLAKELVLRGSGSRGGSGGVPSAQCQARLQEVLGKLRWEVDSDQATRIHHLEAQLELERSLVLKYILGCFGGEHLPIGSLPSSRQASLPPEVHSWGAAGEHTQEGLPQPGQLPGGSSNQRNPDQLKALHALGERGTQLKESALLKESSFPDTPESNLRRSNPPGPLNCSGRELFDKVFAQQYPKDLNEQANVLLAKDQQIEAVHKECQALQAKLNALNVLKERCTHLEEENDRLRKNSFPDMPEKAKRLKCKSVELLILSQRLEAAAKKLQESNLRVSNTQEKAKIPKRKYASQNTEAKKFQKLSSRTENHSLHKISDSDLSLSQREALELQKQIAPKSQRNSLQTPRTATNGSSSSGIVQEASSTIYVGLEDSSLAKEKPKTLNILKKDEASQLVQNSEQVLTNVKQFEHEKQQLECVHEETSPKLQKKEEIEPLQQALTEITREHHGEVQFHPTQVKELQHLYSSQTEYINQHPFRLRCFLARYNYDPLNGPNKNPEAELSLTAGEYVYVCGELDEDGFYVGELTDGRRGFIPSNLVEEVEGNDLFSFIPSEPSDISCDSFHEPNFSCQSAICEGKGNSPDEDRDVSLLSGGPEGTLCEVQAAAPDRQNLTLLTLRNITTTSAEITWVPSNDNYIHLVHLNENKYDVTKAGIYHYTFENLCPSTKYTVKVEPCRLQEALVSPQRGLQQKARELTFTTPSAGPPHAPLDVQVEASSSADFLVISWLPETIHPSGSSNGVQVTGYAIYIGGQKVTEIMSPMAGSVSLEVSQIKTSQGPQAVTVRTVSPFGESADSVPALIPPHPQKVPSTGPTSQDFFESDGRTIPAPEDTDKKTPEEGTEKQTRHDCQCSLENLLSE